MTDTPSHQKPSTTAPGALPSPRLIAFDPAVQFNRSYPPCCRTADKILFVKHTNKGPTSAMAACMSIQRITLQNVDMVTFSCDEYIADDFLRHNFIPIPDVPVKNARDLIHEMIVERFGRDIDDRELVFVRHHLSHAASAYYHSGFGRSIVVTIDGGGDDISGAVYSVDGLQWNKLKEFSAAQALGTFYLQVTKFLGYGQFDEYKVMGLAPYGDTKRYKELFREAYTLFQKEAMLSQIT